jgi:hydrogenase expression/formation protein HypC
MDTIPLRPKRTIYEKHLSCPTCKDEGLPARVLSVDAATNLATVRMEGGEREVALDLLDDVQVGDFILVHIGTAIARLNPADVIET